MAVLTLFIIAFLTGIFTKLADDFEDKKPVTHKGIRIFTGIIYGALIGYVIIKYPVVAPLWIAAVLGNLLFGRINALSHYAAMSALLFFIIFTGISAVNILLVALFTAVCIFEEWFHDIVSRKKLVKNKLLQQIVEFRPMLEIAAFVYSAITGLWIVWLALLCFDMGYIAIKNKKN